MYADYGLSILFEQLTLMLQSEYDFLITTHLLLEPLDSLTLDEMTDLLSFATDYQLTGREFMLTESIRSIPNAPHPDVRRVKDAGGMFRWDRRHDSAYDCEGWQGVPLKQYHIIGAGEFLGITFQIFEQRGGMEPGMCALLSQHLLDHYFRDWFKCPRSRMCGSPLGHRGCCNFGLGVCTWSFAREVISNKVNRDTASRNFGHASVDKLYTPWDLFGADRMLNTCGPTLRTNYWFEVYVNVALLHSQLQGLGEDSVEYCRLHELSESAARKRQTLSTQVMTLIEIRAIELFTQALSRFNSVCKTLSQHPFYRLEVYPWFDFAPAMIYIVPQCITAVGVPPCDEIYQGVCPRCLTWMFFTRPTSSSLKCRTCSTSSPLMWHFDLSAFDQQGSCRVMVAKPTGAAAIMQQSAKNVRRKQRSVEVGSGYHFYAGKTAHRDRVKLCLL